MREIDDFDAVLFQIYLSIYVPIIISLQNVLTKLLQKESGTVFLPHSVVIFIEKIEILGNFSTSF